MKNRPELELVDAPQPSKKQLAVATEVVRAMVGGTIDRLDNEALLALVLGDDVAEAAILDEERAEADALSLALAGQGTHELAELAFALRHAARPRELDEVTHERLLGGALRRKPERRAYWPLVSGVLALAAGVAVFLGSATLERAKREGAALSLQRLAPLVAATRIAPRSTEALFDRALAFELRGGESERVERIVASRASDYRANRFARWGVK